ncbi:MAG: FG-GAP repeat protein [Planctomycetes bacterium]|nr:FG-GAP repeat protein [Planctomycetota bacterium]
MPATPNLPRLAVLLCALLTLVQCKSSSGGSSSDTPPIPNSIVPAAVVTVTEGKGVKLQITVARENGNNARVEVRYATADGSALAGQDYVAVEGTLSWAGGDQAPKTVTVEILDDAFVEGVEQLRVDFFNVQGAAIRNSTTLVYLLDDEHGTSTTDPTQRVLFQLPAAAALASTSDLDGDGYADLLLGDGTRNGGAGQVEVRSGRTGRLLYAIDGATGTALGTAVAGGSDLDQDSRGDFAVALVNGADWKVRLYSGRAGGLLYEWGGQVSGAVQGIAVCLCGDFDRDGVGDVAVGIPQATSPFGSVRVYSGKTGTELRVLSDGANGASFGAAVAAAGDVDRDGSGDLWVGAPDDDGAASAVGALYLFSGRTGARLDRIVGTLVGARLGAALAAAGDIDRDGVPDVIAGAPDAQRSAGEARVFSGATRRLLFTTTGEQEGGRHGTAVAGVGDVNRDGYPDFAVGEPGDLRAPEPIGHVRVFSGRDGVGIDRFVGAGAGAHFGLAVTGAGDGNGDGVADFVCAGSKQVVVFSGRRLELTADRHEMSVSNGGPLLFSLAAGAIGAQRRYWIAGSLSTSPGFPAGGVLVPLNPDAWFRVSLQMPGVQGFQAMRGSLGAEGQAQARLVFPKTTAPAAVGLTLFHAFVVHDDQGALYLASNAVPLNLVQ